MNRTKEVVEEGQGDEQTDFRPKWVNVSHIFALKINTEDNVQLQKPHATNVKDFKKYLATYAVIDSGPP